MSIKKLIGSLEAILVDSFLFNLSYGIAELSQVQNFNINGRFLSLKHEIYLMNQREKFYPNHTDDYQLNFREFILVEESSTACSGSNLDFQQLLLKIL